MTRGDKLRLVAFAVAAGAAVVVMVVVLRGPPRRGAFGYWQRVWQEAPPDERVGIARGMVANKVLIGLSSEKVLSALGPPGDIGTLAWYARPRGAEGGYVRLWVFFDDDGRVELTSVNYQYTEQILDAYDADMRVGRGVQNDE